jgi:PAS domain S-box-containing protein
MGDERVEEPGPHGWDAIVSAALDAILVADDAGRYVEANPAACSLLGLPRQELLGRTVRDFAPPGFDFASTWRQFLNQGTMQGEFTLYLPGGEIREVEYRATARVAPGRHVSFLRDLAERRQSERALIDSERRFRALLDRTGDVFVLSDRHGHVEFVSASAQRTAGVDPAAFVGRPLRDLVVASDRPLLDRAVARALREPGSAIPFRLRVQHADGSDRMFEATCTNLLDDSAVRALVSVLRDISDQEASQRALFESELARRRTEARFRAVVESGADAVKLVDACGVILYASPSISLVFGFTADDLLGKAVFELVHPEDAGALERTFAEVLANPGRPVRSELRYRHRDGSWRRVEALRVNRIDDPDLGAIVTHYRDVTERHRLQEQFHQAQKMEAIGQLAGGIAHDFNNALSAILSIGEIVLQDLKPDDPLRQDVAEMVRAGQRAAALTRQLLAFSRRQPLHPAVVNLNAIILEMERMLRRVIGEHIELRTILPTRLAAVKVDPSQIEQVVLNLVVNARDAIGAQSGRIGIETSDVVLDEDYASVHDVVPGAYVQLTVTDTGCGMDDSVRSRIFEPFFTTKEPGRGTGLGLPTVFGIVKQSGGHIAVQSAPGRGSAFHVYLPASGEAASVVSPLRPASEEDRGTETVLLVEDDDMARAAAVRTLRRAGYRVLEAGNGGEALLIAEQYDREIHLLVTDVVMPRLSGPDLAARIGKLRPAIKTLFVSGYTEHSVITTGLREGSIAFIAKPLVPRTFLKKVRAVIDAKK